MLIKFYLSLLILVQPRADAMNRNGANHTVLSEITAKFFNKYFSRDKVFISIILSKTTKDADHSTGEFLNELFSNPLISNIPYNVFNELHQLDHENRNALYLLPIGDCKDLKNVITEEKVGEVHLSQKFLIVVTETTGTGTVPHILNCIFDVLWRNSLLDSHVLIQENLNVWSLYTFIPYKSDCQTLEHSRIATFARYNFTDELSILTTDLYPEKLDDLNKCPVYIAPSYLDPYIVRLNSFDEHGKPEYRGIEFDIVTQISKTLNFEIVFKRSTNGSGYGVAFENGTITENFAMVFHGEVNLTMGGSAQSLLRCNLFSCSIPYLQGSNGFCYKEDDAYVPITRLTAPFENQIWIVICVLLIISTLIILKTKNLPQQWRHFIVGGRRNRTPILNMWSSVLGLPISNPKICNGGRYFGTFARTLTLLWIITWLVIRNSYQGSLYTFLQSHKVISKYDTMAKIRASKCTIMATPTAISLFNDIVKENRFIVGGDGMIENLNTFYDTNVACVAHTNDLVLKLYNLKNPNRRLTFTKDRLLLYPPVFLFKKKSALTRVFNQQIHYLQESGLIDHWTKNHIDSHGRTSKKTKPTMLELKSVLAAFQICGVFYFISFLVFVLEMMSVRYRRIKRVLDYFTY